MKEQAQQATALAHPNIAFIKYWGLKNPQEKIPGNGSLSMNLGCLSTRTTVTLSPELKSDNLVLNGAAVTGPGLIRVQKFMDRIRQLVGRPVHARIQSENNFPMGAGVASSASAFAALALAATKAFGLSLTETELSALARFGSGSASRSVPGGFVIWQKDQPFAKTIAPADHWKLLDCIAILSEQHKPVGSEEGMLLADSSPLQAARVADADRRLALCQHAIQNKDFEALASVTELDSNLMHAVMMTSTPPLFYWAPASLKIIKAVKRWQKEGLPVTCTLDAGPNVHLICLPESMPTILKRLRQIPEVIEILKGFPAGPARLSERPLDSER